MTAPTRRSLSRIALVFGCLLTILSTISCNHPAPAKPAERHPFKGKIVSIDKPGGVISVDAEAIPGFMDAMIMPYKVKPESQLDQLAVDDLIEADVVLQDDKYWLENVRVTQHATGPAPKPTAALHVPVAGNLVPNFEFTNQNGKRISLKQYRGQAVLLTFIYTRCPFADYCPRISSQFAEINRQLEKDPALYRKTHLLSISFDPAHDTPKVLRQYGFSCSGSQQPSLFRHWEFAAPPAAQLSALANYFALSYEPDAGLITHSLSTAVIGPDGRVFRWYHGSDWQPAQLIKDATDALHPAG